MGSLAILLLFNLAEKGGRVADNLVHLATQSRAGLDLALAIDFGRTILHLDIFVRLELRHLLRRGSSS